MSIETPGELRLSVDADTVFKLDALTRRVEAMSDILVGVAPLIDIMKEVGSKVNDKVDNEGFCNFKMCVDARSMELHKILMVLRQGIGKELQGVEVGAATKVSIPFANGEAVAKVAELAVISAVPGDVAPSAASSGAEREEGEEVPDNGSMAPAAAYGGEEHQEGQEGAIDSHRDAESVHEAQVKCKWNHTMILLSKNPVGYSRKACCDVCGMGNLPKKRNPFYHCSHCRWDLCLNCAYKWWPSEGADD